MARVRKIVGTILAVLGALVIIGSLMLLANGHGALIPLLEGVLFVWAGKMTYDGVRAVIIIARFLSALGLLVFGFYTVILAGTMAVTPAVIMGALTAVSIAGLVISLRRR